MWSYGFHNSVNGDRVYNADQMSGIFDGLITAGVYESVGNKLAVQPNSGMTIQIATGRGWFNNRWVNNDSPYLINLEASDVTLNRYAAICVKGDNSTGVRTTQPYVKYSEYATTPVKPTMTRTNDVKEYCLAYVYIRHGATSITAADIEDTRQNTSLCGWVTGLVEQITPDTLYTQFTAQFNDWFSGLQDDLDANTEAMLVAALPKSLTSNLTVAGWVKYGVVDLGSLNWTKTQDGTKTYYIATNYGMKSASDNIVANIYCDRYKADTVNNVYYNRTDKTIAIQSSKVWVYDTSYTDAATFKAAVSGVKLIYELSDPASYTGDTAYTQTATVTGMNATKSVVISPNSATAEAYSNAGIKAAAQATNSITFTANTKPTTAISVDILHMGQ